MKRLFVILILSLNSVGFGVQHACAATATYVQPNTLSATQLSALSTSGDNLGVSVPRSTTLQLLFDTSFGVSNSDRVSVFTLPSGNPFPVSLGRVSFGRYENGVATLVQGATFFSGSRINANQLFRQGCGAIGGCNFIEVTTLFTFGGPSEGVRVDYVQVNGEVVTVTAAAPEPAVWAMMIIGFVLISARLKQRRRSRPMYRHSAAFLLAS